MSARHPDLEPDATVYRAVLRRNWIDPDSGELLPDAFVRRPQGDEDGLSVHIAGACNVMDVVNQFNRCYAVVALRVGDVRDLGLDVIPDSPDHACITGLPFREEDPARAERLAGLLARRSRFEYRRPDPA